MAGLLSGVLPYLYQQGDRAKRHVNSLLSDPLGVLEQTAGGLLDSHRAQQNLLAQAFADKGKPFRVTDANAMQAAAQNMLAGPLGFAPVGMFAGVGAKTANKVAFEAAEEMERRGVPAPTIWSQTGWARGPDKKWRFEIDDSASALRPQSKTAVEYLAGPGPADYPVKVQDLLAHEKLIAAYPEFGTMRGTLSRETRGEFGVDPFGPVIQVGANHRNGTFADPAQTRSQTLHELQHATQAREGFSRGGDANTLSADVYKRLAGEAEARLVQQRMNMTAAQRAAQYPWEPSYFQAATGVPLNQLIFTGR